MSTRLQSGTPAAALPVRHEAPRHPPALRAAQGAACSIRPPGGDISSSATLESVLSWRRFCQQCPGGLAQERGLGPGFGIAKRTRPAVSPAAPRDRVGAASPSDIASPACRPKTPRGGAHSPWGERGSSPEPLCCCCCCPWLTPWLTLWLTPRLGPWLTPWLTLWLTPWLGPVAHPEARPRGSPRGSAPWLTPWLGPVAHPVARPVAHPEARPRGSPRGSAPWLTPWLGPVAHPVARPVVRAPCCPRRWSLCTGLALCECNGQGRRNRADLPARQLRQ
ncbi:unnamed protein product [Lampetra fluviatilis]